MYFFGYRSSAPTGPRDLVQGAIQGAKDTLAVMLFVAFIATVSVAKLHPVWLERAGIHLWIYTLIVILAGLAGPAIAGALCASSRLLLVGLIAGVVRILPVCIVLAYMPYPPSLSGWQYGLGLALTLSAVIGLPTGWLLWRVAIHDQRELDRLN